MTTREIILAVGVVFCVGYGWLSIGQTAPNERSRIYLSVAMAERGDLQIDPEVYRYGWNWDLSYKNRRFYCNKPPGSSLLGAVVYGLADAVTPDGAWSMPALFQLMRFGVMLPLALLGFVAIRRWMEMLEISDPVVDLASVAWMLGSAAFHYAGAFFSHHIVAVCFVVGLWLLESVRQRVVAPPDGSGGHPASGPLSMLGAGVALGLAGMTEYQAGIGCAFVAIWVVRTPELRTLKLMAPFTLGAGVFLVGLFAYNTIAFGGPLEFSYKYHLSGGGEPFTWPSFYYFSGLMWSLHRGLFASAPWVLLMIPGALILYRSREWKGVSVLLTGVVAFRILLLSSYEWWSGDWGFGPRHLVPVMGIATVLAAVAMDRWWGSLGGEIVARGGVLAGLAYNQIQVAFLPEMPLDAMNPIFDVAIPLYERGIPTPNLMAAWTGSTNLWTLVPLVVIAVGFAAFVLGRGLGRRRSSCRERALVVGASVLPTLLFGLSMALQGPNWTRLEREDFAEEVETRLEEDVQWHQGSATSPAQKPDRKGTLREIPFQRPP